MRKVCSRCGNAVTDNEMFCNKCGNRLGNETNREHQIIAASKTKDFLPEMIHKYQRQLIIAVVVLLAIVVIMAAVIGKTPKVVGAWEMTKGYSIYSEKFIVHINKNTIVLSDGGDTDTYPIKIKKDEIIINKSLEGDGEVIWKYQIQGDSIIIECQYNLDGEWETETITGVRIE